MGRARPRPGRCCSSCSTTLPDSNRAIADQLAASGHHFVEAPAHRRRHRRPEPRPRLHGRRRRRAGEPCLPILEQLGRATFHVGPVGTGTTMKLANSLLAMACTWASFESLSLAAKAGIDLRTAVEVIRTAGVTNFYIDRGVEGINVRGKPAEFTLELAAKDAGLINEIAAATGVPAEIAQAASLAARRRGGPRPRRPRLDRPRARRRGESRRRAAPAARRRRAERAARRHRGRLLHRPRRSGRGAPPARQPVPELRRGVLPAALRVRPVPARGHRRRGARPARARSTRGRTCTCRCSPRGTPRSMPTASARSTCPRAPACRRSSSAAPTTSRSAWSWSSSSSRSAPTRTATTS